MVFDLTEKDKVIKDVQKDIIDASKRLQEEAIPSVAESIYGITASKLRAVVSVLSTLPYNIARPTMDILNTCPMLEDYIFKTKDGDE